jgi:hypothetical protein
MHLPKFNYTSCSACVADVQFVFSVSPSNILEVHHTLRSGMSPIIGTLFHKKGVDLDLCAHEFEKLLEVEKRNFEVVKWPGCAPIQWMSNSTGGGAVANSDTENFRSDSGSGGGGGDGVIAIAIATPTFVADDDARSVAVKSCKAVQRSSDLYDICIDAAAVKGRYVVNLFSVTLLSFELRYCGHQCPLDTIVTSHVTICSMRNRRFESFMISLSTKTGCGYSPVPLKSPYRTSEKIGFASGWDQWDASNVTDMVRGAQEMSSVANGLMLLELLIACDPIEAPMSQKRGWNAKAAGVTDEIVIVGVKNRWKTPAPGGWSDSLINFAFVSDPAQHICEVQLVHSDMMRVRKLMGAHKGYNRFRCALELLEATEHSDLIAEMKPGYVGNNLGDGNKDSADGGGVCDCESLPSLHGNSSSVSSKLLGELRTNLASYAGRLDQKDAVIDSLVAKVASLEATLHEALLEIARIAAVVQSHTQYE